MYGCWQRRVLEIEASSVWLGTVEHRKCPQSLFMKSMCSRQTCDHPYSSHVAQPSLFWLCFCFLKLNPLPLSWDPWFSTLAAPRNHRQCHCPQLSRDRLTRSWSWAWGARGARLPGCQGEHFHSEHRFFILFSLYVLPRNLSCFPHLKLLSPSLCQMPQLTFSRPRLHLLLGVSTQKPCSTSGSIFQVQTKYFMPRACSPAAASFGHLTAVHPVAEAGTL